MVTYHVRHAALAAVSVVGHAGVVEDGTGALIDVIMTCKAATPARLMQVICNLDELRLASTRAPAVLTRSIHNRCRGCVHVCSHRAA